jgi:ring-1,2-phenylacetyl-CoA epoxidase subunit PaaC
VQLIQAGGEARQRMEAAIKKVLVDFEGVLTLGPLGYEIAKHGLIETEERLKQRWLYMMKPVLESVNLSVSESDFAMKNGNGRKGEHTADLDAALSTLSEVYNVNPAASW